MTEDLLIRTGVWPEQSKDRVFLYGWMRVTSRKSGEAKTPMDFKALLTPAEAVELASHLLKAAEGAMAGDTGWRQIRRPADE